MATKEDKKLNVNELMSTMEGWFAKLPELPVSARDIIVKIAPWFALIFGILGVLGSIAATGFLTVLSPVVALGGGLGVAAGGIVAALGGIVSSVLMILAFPGLKANKTAGWKYSFYSQAVSVIAAVLSFNLVGAVISALVGFYLLFQIKSYYK